MTDIERIKELLPKITQGEWRIKDPNLFVDSYLGYIVCGLPATPEDAEKGRWAFCGTGRDNAEFIALCRNNIAAILEENDRLKEELRQAERYRSDHGSW